MDVDLFTVASSKTKLGEGGALEFFIAVKNNLRCVCVCVLACAGCRYSFRPVFCSVLAFLQLTLKSFSHRHLEDAKLRIFDFCKFKLGSIGRIKTYCKRKSIN